MSLCKSTVYKFIKSTNLSLWDLENYELILQLTRVSVAYSSQSLRFTPLLVMLKSKLEQMDLLKRKSMLDVKVAARTAPVFFMIGCQRSGSNWLRTMLAEREDLIAPHPPHIMRDFMPILSKFGDLENMSNLKVSRRFDFLTLIYLCFGRLVSSNLLTFYLFTVGAGGSCLHLCWTEPGYVAWQAWPTNQVW